MHHLVHRQNDNNVNFVENQITNHAERSQLFKHSHVTFRSFKVTLSFLQIFDCAKPLPHNSESFSAKFVAPVCRTQSSGKLFISEVVIKWLASIVNKVFIHVVCHLVQKPRDVFEFFVHLSVDPSRETAHNVFGLIL